MKKYHKIKSISEEVAKLKKAGMKISNAKKCEKAIKQIGLYKLKGYYNVFYDKTKKKFIKKISFDEILMIYEFDKELSVLLIKWLKVIEISLRSFFLEATLEAHKDQYIYLKPEYSEKKKEFWENLSSLANEITRTNDKFIKYDFDNKKGLLPLWAVLEVSSFGSLSKMISIFDKKDKTMKLLLSNYHIKTKNNITNPSSDIFISNVKTCHYMRNKCCHSSRLYNIRITKKPALVGNDYKSVIEDNYGCFQAILSMKYLLSWNDDWNIFVKELNRLINKYKYYINMEDLCFPKNWKSYLKRYDEQ